MPRKIATNDALSTRVNRPQMGVLMRQFSPSAGGAEAYAYRLVQNLSGHYQFHVFAQQFGAPIDGVVFETVPHIKWLPRWLNQWHYSRSTQRLSAGLDLVHSHENTAHGQVQTLHVQTVAANLFGANAKRRPWVSSLKALTSPRIAFYLLMERARLRNRAVVFASQALKTDTLSFFPGLHACGVIPPGTHAPQLSSPEVKSANKTQLIANWAGPALPPDHAKWLLLGANDCEKKGLGVLLQALAASAPNIHLLVAGKPDQHRRFKPVIAKLGLQARVHLLGSMGNMAALYGACDVLVHPTQQDAYPMVVLEAFGHGLPVITTPAPFNGLAARLQHANQALLMPHPHDAPALAALIDQVLNQPSLAQSLREQGHRFAQTHSWDQVGAQYRRVYDALLNAS